MSIDYPCFGLIPARYHSSRFPGKPLTDIHGKPMFYRVYERAAASRRLQRTWIATDDQRIMAAAHQLGVPAVMTAADHPSGSDRIMEAADQLGLADESVIVNIQGDEPELDSGMIDQLVAPFSDSATEVTTLARPISADLAANPDRVKIACSRRGLALYFSRAPIPYNRDGDPGAGYLLHIGLYAYRLPILRKFTGLPPSPLEQIEKLEQLRLLEAGISIRVGLTDYQGFGIDRPEDLRELLDRTAGS